MKNKVAAFVALLLLTAVGEETADSVKQMPTRSALQGARAYVAAIVSQDQSDVIEGKLSFLDCAHRWLDRANLMTSARDEPARFLLYKGVYNLAVLGGDEELALAMVDKLKTMGAPVEARVFIMYEPLRAVYDGFPKLCALLESEYMEMKRLEKERKWTYVVDPKDGEITLTGVEPKPYTTLELPGEVDGRRVKCLGNGLLSGCSLLKALMLPKDHAVGMEPDWMAGATELKVVFSPCKDQWHVRSMFANRGFIVYARQNWCVDHTSSYDDRKFLPYPDDADEMFQSF